MLENKLGSRIEHSEKMQPACKIHFLLGQRYVRNLFRYICKKGSQVNGLADMQWQGKDSQLWVFKGLLATGGLFVEDAA